MRGMRGRKRREEVREGGGMLLRRSRSRRIEMYRRCLKVSGKFSYLKNSRGLLVGYNNSGVSAWLRYTFAIALVDM